MALLKHGDFEFKNILKGGYKIKEDEPEILSEVKMSDRSIKRNYGDMPKTSIKIKFGRLDADTYKEYMSHFAKDEDIYSYFCPNTKTMKTKKFFVKRPEVSVLSTAVNEKYDEFEIELNQCGVI